jgi:hypothetical protein
MAIAEPEGMIEMPRAQPNMMTAPNPGVKANRVYYKPPQVSVRPTATLAVAAEEKIEKAMPATVAALAVGGEEGKLSKMSVADVDVKGKRVLMRVDFNVPQVKAVLARFSLHASVCPRAALASDNVSEPQEAVAQLPRREGQARAHARGLQRAAGQGRPDEDHEHCAH